MEERKVQRGKDGMFSLCLKNSERKTQQEILEEANKYGECVGIKQIPSGFVFIRFMEEDEAQRCLDANPHMRVGFEKKQFEKNAPKMPGKMSEWKSRQGETKATEETHSENPKLQHEINEGKIMLLPRCLDGNPHVRVRLEKKQLGKNAPKKPGKMSEWKSRQGETTATEETLSENPKLQHESNEDNAETPSRKCPNIDISKDIQEERKTHVNGTKQKVRTPKYRGKNGEMNGELPRSHGKCNSSEQPNSNLLDEMPPLINRATGRPPKKLAVDMIFANFPDSITRDDIENLVETLHPLKVGSILKTKWNEPYCHVYVTEEAAILAERDYNLALYGGYSLVVARARTLLAEAHKTTPK